MCLNRNVTKFATKVYKHIFTLLVLVILVMRRLSILLNHLDFATRQWNQIMFLHKIAEFSPIAWLFLLLVRLDCWTACRSRKPRVLKVPINFQSDSGLGILMASPKWQYCFSKTIFLLNKIHLWNNYLVERCNLSQPWHLHIRVSELKVSEPILGCIVYLPIWQYCYYSLFQLRPKP